jgi:excisionase family DNA binding protein
MGKSLHRQEVEKCTTLDHTQSWRKEKAGQFPGHHKLCLSVTEAAEQLGVCRNHLYSYINNGTLPSFVLGRRRLVNHEALDEFRLSLQQKHLSETRGVK